MNRSRVAIVSAGYKARSLQANAQRRVNVFLELDDSSERAPKALYGRPGLKLQTTFPEPTARGAIEFGGASYWVYGVSVYKFTADGSISKAGEVQSTSGVVSMAASSIEVLVVDGAGGWIINASGMSQITDEGFPTGVTFATYQDGSFIVSGDGTGTFYLSNILDGGSWNTLDQATAESNPDPLRRAMNYNQQLMLLGDKTTEFWQNTGDASFPYQRLGNGVTQMGVCAPASALEVDNSVLWLGRNKEGEGVCFRLNGWTPQRISESAIERVWQGYPTIADAHSYAFQTEGHLFYVLQFPEADATWVYDVSTGLWFEWLYHDLASNTEHAFRGSVYLRWNGRHYVGDGKDGRLYSIEMDYGLDDDQSIKSVVSFPAIENDQRRTFFHRLQVDMETGAGELENSESNYAQLIEDFVNLDGLVSLA